MPRRPRVNVRQVPSGSWEVQCKAKQPEYRVRWPNEADARRDAIRLERELSGAGLDSGQIRGVEAALHRLATVECPGKGSTLAFAVEWFLTHYKGADTSLTLCEYVTRYLALKKEELEEKSMTEQHQYLDPLAEEFGKFKPAEILVASLKLHITSKKSRYHRYKILHPFFGWLSADPDCRVERLEEPPLEKSPLDYITRPRYTKAKPTEILTLAEVQKVLAEAKAEDARPLRKGDKSECLAWCVWGLFTGMRPEAEMRPFWEQEAHAWSRVDLERGQIVVTDDLEKTGSVNRDVTIQPALRDWIAWMKATGKQPYFSRRAMRRVFDRATPKKNAQDILRHTFISNALHIMKEQDVCFEAATSSKMIKKHYRRQVPRIEWETFWKITPASLGL